MNHENKEQCPCSAGPSADYRQYIGQPQNLLTVTTRKKLASSFSKSFKSTTTQMHVVEDLLAGVEEVASK
jgi:hypothetical protein